MVLDTANRLAAEIKESEEYKRFKAAREAVGADSMTVNLLKEYRGLQLKAQAAMVANETDEITLEKLQKLGELLQMDRAASEYLIAEFMLSSMVGDIYRILAEAVDLDLSMLE